jgi:hypothetical protein
MFPASILGPFHGVLQSQDAGIVRYVGALDSLDASAYTDVVGAYALRRLYVEYEGAQIQIRRSTDNVLADIHFDSIGAPTKIVFGVEESIQSIETWLNGAEARVRTWYDQSGGVKDLVQQSNSAQPIMKHEPSMCGYVVYFNNTNLTGANFSLLLQLQICI